MALDHERDDELNLLHGELDAVHADTHDTADEDAIEPGSSAGSADNLLDDSPDADSDVQNNSSSDYLARDTSESASEGISNASRNRGVITHVVANWVAVACLLFAVSLGWVLFTRINSLTTQVRTLRDETFITTPTDTTEIERLNGVIAELSKKVDALAAQSSIVSPSTESTFVDQVVDAPTDSLDRVAEELRKQQQILDGISKTKNGDRDIPRVNAAMEIQAPRRDLNAAPGQVEHP